MTVVNQTDLSAVTGSRQGNRQGNGVGSCGGDRLRGSEEIVTTDPPGA